jgi:hypothetical protein
MHDNGAGCSSQTINHVAANGHFHVLEWLNKNNIYLSGSTWWTWSMPAVDRAAANGHLDVVQCLYSHRRKGCSTDAMDGAAANGHLDVIQ